MMDLSTGHFGSFVDAVQTAALLVTAGAQIYTMLLLRNEMRSAADGLRRVLDGQAETTAAIERLWAAIMEIQMRVGIRTRPPEP